MSARFTLNSAEYQHSFAGLLIAVGLAMGPFCNQAPAQTPQGIAVSRLVSEIRELKRLVFQLKRDEYNARCERDLLRKHRDNAQRFANGGEHVSHRCGFAALLQICGQTPSQASLLQSHVPALSADQFVPETKRGFAGGEVAQLVQFCRRANAGVRYGSRAQLVIAELTHDLIRQADDRIAVLGERIEDLKSQNIAHTDVIGKLILAVHHCHACRHCFHYGYGGCAAVPAFVIDEPPAGLNSKAYDRTLTRAILPRKNHVAEDRGRLTFLEPASPKDEQ